MSESSDDRLARLEARRKRREQRRLSLDTDEESKHVNGTGEGDVDVGGRSRSSTTDSEIEASRALTREEERQERRDKRRQQEMAEKAKEQGAKSAAVVTDFSKREIRERRPSDPEILSGDSESVDDAERENDEKSANQGKKKTGYGAYASALRRDSQGGDVDKRKERYAAAVEGYHIDDDDDDIDLEPSVDPHAQQPEIMSTSPVKRIKEDYLTSATRKSKAVPHSEEQPTPHHLARQWPPLPTAKEDDADEQEPRKGVVKTFEEVEAPEEDRGVDDGHVESVQSLKAQWQHKEPAKQPGVNKPYVPIKKDGEWITHFRPVIDEGETPKEPQWLQMVRQRRWRSTVAARFPQDEQEKEVFEKRSTTPRKFKKPNPYSLMRSKSDLEDEFEIAMRRRRRKTDDDESIDGSKRSWTSMSDFDQESVGVLNKVPIQGPLKEYKKNLALERARSTMLKWTFSTDMVDDPVRFDLPKPIDLTTQEDYEKEQEWRYMQSRRRFTGSQSTTDGMGSPSLRSSTSSLSEAEYPKSPVASTSGQPEQKMSTSSDQSPPSPQDHQHMSDDSGGAGNDTELAFCRGVSDIKKSLLGSTQEALLKPTVAEENLEYVPRLADIKKKIQQREEEALPRGVPLDGEIQMIPKMKDIKSKFLTPKEEHDPKRPEFNEDEHFERLDSLRSKFLSQGKEEEQKAPAKPKLKKKLSTSDDMKAIMASRRQMSDEYASEGQQSTSDAATTQEIKSLASDIAKTFGLENGDSVEKPAKKSMKQKMGEDIKPVENGSASEESDSKPVGPCGKPEGCGTDDELDKRMSKELDILPTLGDEMNEEPGPILPLKRNDVLESSPQRGSFTDEEKEDEGKTSWKNQESTDTVETSAKESETESDVEMNTKQVKDDGDDDDDDYGDRKRDADGADDDEKGEDYDDGDFLSSESDDIKDDADGSKDLEESDEEVDGNVKSRMPAERPKSSILEDVKKKKKLLQEDERPRSFAFGDDEGDDPHVTSKYVPEMLL